MTNNNKNNDDKLVVLHSIIAILLVIIIWLLIYIFWVNTKEIKTTSTSTWNTVNTTNSWDTLNNTENNKNLEVTVFWDTRCSDCATDQTVLSLKQVPALSSINFETKDYNDEWVKEILKTKWITTLPAFVFNTNKIDAWIDSYLMPLSDWTYYLNIGATFDPSAEICDNSVDDTNDWQIDCADTTCSSKLVCREEKKWQLDVFLMGYCPFGELAAKAMPDLKKAFGDELKINLHYIATKTWEWFTANDFNSLHWVSEAEENIRQLCITKHYWTDKTIDYMQTRYKNADNYWKVSDDKSLAYEANWIDATKIDDCVTNWEWGQLLAEDVKIAEELAIWWSPTWFANNKYTFGWIEATSIQTEFCKYNTELKWCANIIEVAPSTSNWQPSCN